MREIIGKLVANPRYLANIEYGEPRAGHPEGKVKYHISELEDALEILKRRLDSEEDYWKLKFLIYVHDAFKAEAEHDVPVLHPQSHATLARGFASKFVADADLLNMIQFHDESYLLWQGLQRSGDYDHPRFMRLLDTIRDWDLFLVFTIIDGSSTGKDPSRLKWFVGEVRKYKKTRVDDSWILKK